MPHPTTRAALGSLVAIVLKKGEELGGLKRVGTMTAMETRENRKTD